MRRKPRRSNARETVAAIFEATARLLEKDGRRGLTTNRIAETAGVSIGALYGYFPNREAILLAMARAELDRARDAVMAALQPPFPPGTSPTRLAVRALIRGYGPRTRARRILMETLFAFGEPDEMARPLREVAEALAIAGAAVLPAGAPAVSAVELFAITRAIDGAVRAAANEGSAFLNTPAFEDALVRLAEGFFLAPLQSRGGGEERA